DYAAGIEADPRRLEDVEQRRDVRSRLTQKYGPTFPDGLATRDRTARELDLLDTADLDLRQIAEQRAAAAAEFARACTALSGKRRRGAERLGHAVNELLPALGMPGGRFAAHLVALPAPQGSGAEGVVFEIQLNVGMEARPLAKVASGGELSRLMLALKVVLAEHDAVPTLVFDEVDQGIGGEVGGRVGEALAGVARGSGGSHQVLVITHLPQIAVFADHHLVVAKGAKSGLATSDVQLASGAARTRELARMLGDPDMGTALRHAEELLRKASASSASRSGTPVPPASPRRSRREPRVETVQRGDVNARVVSRVPGEPGGGREGHEDRAERRDTTHARAGTLDAPAYGDVQPQPAPHEQLLNEAPLDVHLMVSQPLAQPVVVRVTLCGRQSQQSDECGRVMGARCQPILRRDLDIPQSE